jgi:hypothetical protein
MKRSLDAHAVEFSRGRVLSILTAYRDQRQNLCQILSIQKSTCEKVFTRIVYAVYEETVWNVYVNKGLNVYERFFNEMTPDFSEAISEQLFLGLRR